MNKWLKILIYILGTVWGIFSGLFLIFADMLQGMAGPGHYNPEDIEWSFSLTEFLLLFPATFPGTIMQFFIKPLSSFWVFPVAIITGFLLAKLVIKIISLRKN